MDFYGLVVNMQSRGLWETVWSLLTLWLCILNYILNYNIRANTLVCLYMLNRDYLLKFATMIPINAINETKNHY